MTHSHAETASKHLLVVEDEEAIRDLLRDALARHGFAVDTVESAMEARQALADKRYDLALVDWMLPGSSGIELIRSLRKEELYRDLPVIMLTARSNEADITQGLDAGADDYIVKPFSPRELHSRVKALLRRTNPAQPVTLKVGALTLNTESQRVKVDDREIRLGHTEYKLLTFLMQNPDRVYSRAQLLDHVWGPGTFIEERTVDVHVLRLRKNLKPGGADSLLETVRGAGYRLTS